MGTGGGQILLGAAALQELRLGQCGLRGIPEAVLQLTGLRLLDVSSNILEQVSSSRPSVLSRRGFHAFSHHA